MPKILIFRNIWIFIIYATDMYEKRMHVHVGKRDTTELCKIWLEPDIEIASTGELTLKQQNEVKAIVETYKNEMVKQWNDFLNGKTIKTIKVK